MLGQTTSVANQNTFQSSQCGITVKSIVKIIGLRSKTELNNSIGEVTGFQNQRYNIRLPGHTTTYQIKKENLIITGQMTHEDETVLAAINQREQRIDFDHGPEFKKYIHILTALFDNNYPNTQRISPEILSDLSQRFFTLSTQEREAYSKQTIRNEYELAISALIHLELTKPPSHV